MTDDQTILLLMFGDAMAALGRSVQLYWDAISVKSRAYDARTFPDPTIAQVGRAVSVDTNRGYAYTKVFCSEAKAASTIRRTESSPPP